MKRMFVVESVEESNAYWRMAQAGIKDSAKNYGKGYVDDYVIRIDGKWLYTGKGVGISRDPAHVRRFNNVDEVYDLAKDILLGKVSIGSITPEFVEVVTGLGQDDEDVDGRMNADDGLPVD